MQPATNAPPVSHPIARSYRLAALLAAVLVVSIACGGGGSSDPTQTDDLDPAPDFTTVLYSGGTGEFTLSEQQGHPVVLNVWGSWCPPCRAEFPDLQQAWDQYKDQGLVLFPFRDGPEQLIAAGVKAIVQPGGSKRDDETIAACEEAGVTMLLTGQRLFRH